MEFSPAVRRANIDQLKSGVFDLVVIGGGITGAGIVREAAVRGLKVALVEKGDFASGTSSRSARMVHGGLRYLQHHQFRLVLSACKERDRLRQLAPRLVRPTAFTFPVYLGSKNGLVKIRLGMWLYDLLAFFRNVKRHRILGPRQVVLLEPSLSTEGLVGAAHYYDCLTDDARLTLVTIQSAYQLGALVANYTEVRDLLKDDGRVSGVVALDRITGETFTVRARVTVNATGVWVDRLRCMDDPSARPIIRANRGIHLVVPLKRLGIRGAVAFTSVDGERALYAVPWGDTCILGTTDVDHSGDPDEVHATSDEVESLLISVNRTFPKANLTQGDILSTFAGLRPLINEGGKTAYQLSREYEIMDSASGLISITGGKLTTFGRMAQDLVERVFGELRADFGIRLARTKGADHVPLTDVTFDPELELTKLAENYPQFDHGVLKRVVLTYGPDAALVLGLTENDAQMARRIVPGLPYLRAEIPYAIKHEMAMTLSDLLKRRTRIIHEDKEQGLGCASEVAQAMAPFLGWDSAEIERQIGAYRREVALSRAYLKETQP